MSYTLLIIDPQRDFHEGGSLAVAGATADSRNIVKLLNAKAPAKVIVSLDTHTPTHVGHHRFWVDKDGNNPNPFTPMSVESATIISRAGAVVTEWMPARAELKDWATFYVKNLPENGRGAMLVWPDHCLEGTPGHEVFPELKAKLDTLTVPVEYHMKGQNEASEMYSLFAAELPVEKYELAPKDLYTGVLPTQATSLSTSGDNATGAFLQTTDNEALVERLAEGSLPIVVCGEALSHCVNWSTRDLYRILRSKGLDNPIIVLRDASSAVGGFESAVGEFMTWCDTNGVRATTVDEFIATQSGGARRNTRKNNRRNRRRNSRARRSSRRN